MFDAKKLLDQFLGSQVPGAGGTVRGRADQVTKVAKDNPLASGAIAAVLLGTKSGRKLAGNAAVLGGLAAIAGLGYQAYKNYQSGKEPAAEPASRAPAQLPAPPAASGFAAPEALSEDFALVLVRAMIAAARADGHIDASERGRIMDKLSVSGLSADAAAFLEAELVNPIDLDAIVSAGKTEEERVEIYTASRLAIEPDGRAERGYLDLLAGRLGLADALVDHIEATVSAAKIPA
ncbi:tellurite resistance TerB family protein [Sinorhizobium medicae]|uniref:tellurite resistance TerB family protein n=1 Tax=Sinorhizobium medicae TaxID=110321 RepID=UPI002AF6BB1B|nr:tellurite resistance TerB family protein [Sinorhizobium medicae]WQO45082.1 tellurite resistance TerB family protein [Sinorhizobium medicae]WQO65240.1 tellurite resistance TerB family protein [Sinorhizobium medicae]WQO72365.1 tellurite resistance TerB family protein [Sinorhizobium medicae]WQO91678.1 tellurite resistance TerB family protein [Sinorhizobium medicae]